MALPVYTSSAFTGQSGLEIAAGASVEVRSEEDDSLVTLYSDRDGTVQIDNPATTDAYGRFAFFGAPNADGWRITVTSGSDTHTLRYQQPMGSTGGTQAAAFMMGFLAAANEASARTGLGLGTMAVETAADYAKLSSSAPFTATQTMPQLAVKAADASTDPAGYLRDENGAAVGIWFYDRSDNTIRLRHSGNLKDIIIYESGGVSLTDATGGDPGAGGFNAGSYQQSGVPIAGATAWVNFTGTGTVGINDSFNVLSVTDNGSGDYTVNFETAMANADYSYAGMIQESATSAFGNSIHAKAGGIHTTSALQIVVKSGNGSTTFDQPQVCVHFFGGM